ncbi:MAG: response regulator [Bacteroidota bacterium]
MNNESIRFSTPDGKSAEFLRILLVDDNRVNLFLGKRILSSLGMPNVVLASSGKEALDLFISEPFDVVLTDVEMPGMNGYTLCSNIRAINPDSGKRPVLVVISANAGEHDRQDAAEAGVDGYLTKPYSPEDLTRLFSTLLPTAEPILFQEIETQDVKGMEKVHALFHYDLPDVRAFLCMLSKQIPELHTEIQNGLGDPSLVAGIEQAFQAAHKLKSPVFLLCPEQDASEFSTFTELLREGKIPTDLDLISRIIEALEANINAELERIG